MLNLSVVNRKGGVAKTTSSVNIAAELSARGIPTLVVDLDPQATLTLVSGIDPEALTPPETVLTALVPELGSGSPPAPLRATWGGDVLAASSALVQAETALADATVAGPNARLERALRAYAADYQVCLIDSPPSLGKLVMNALCASRYLLVPVACDYASAGGLARLARTVELVREYENPELEILGVFATQTRPTMHARETQRALERRLGALWFDVAIPQAVAIQDSQAQHLSIRGYDPRSKAAFAYRRLTERIVERLRERGELGGELAAA